MDNRAIEYAKLKADFEQQKMLLQKQSKLSQQLQMALEIVNRNLLKEKEQNEALRQEINGTDEAGEMLQSTMLELKRAKTEVNHLKQMEQAYELKVEQLGDQVVMLEVQQEQLQNEQRILQENELAIQRRYEELEKTFATANHEVIELKQQNEDLQEALNEAQLANEMLVSQHRETLTENQRSYEESINALTNKLQDMQQERDLFEQQYMHILEQSTEDQLALEEQIAQLTSQLQYETEEREAAELQLKSQLDEINKYELKIDQLEVEGQYHATKSGEQIAKIDQLKKELKEARTINASLEQTNKNLQQMINEYPMQLSPEPLAESNTLLEKEAKNYIEELIKGNVSFGEEVTSIQQYVTKHKSEFAADLLVNEALQLVKESLLNEVEQYKVALH